MPSKLILGIALYALSIAISKVSPKAVMQKTLPPDERILLSTNFVPAETVSHFH